MVPALRKLPLDSALRPLILPHCFRYIGLTLLGPATAAGALPEGFAYPAAWGDFAAALLALLSLLALSRRWRFRLAVVWLFNLEGAIDLVYAVGAASATGASGSAGAPLYWLVAVFVPALLVSHALIFLFLLRPPTTAAAKR